MTTRRVPLRWLLAWSLLATGSLAQTMPLAYQGPPTNAGTPASGAHRIRLSRELPGKVADDDWDGDLGANGQH